MAAKPAPAPAANVALDVGMTFDTEQSPLFQRVFNTLSVSPLLIQLREDLTEMAQRAPRQDRTHWKRNASDDDSIVKLYDLSNINSMRLVHVLNWDRFGDRNVFAQEVNAFMRHLRSPMADSHSRIVILNRYQGSLLDFETALHLHIMIVELEVPIDMAAGLLHLCQGYLGPGNTLGAAANLWAQVLPLGHVRFGKSYLPPMNWNISAVDLKMCNFSGRSAHTALICSDGAQYHECVVNALERHEDDQWFARRQVPPPRFQRTDTRGVVSNALNRWPASNLEAYLAVDEDDSITRVAKGQPTSHWLNAVIRTIAFRYSCRPSNLRTKLSSMEDDEFEAFCDEVATEHQAAKLDLFKIESFLARHRDLDRSNCASALQSLAVTVEYLRADYENICASFERRSTLRSLEMARRSIDESRATIRLTWLATVFLPISLASSIFGMNVREINNQKTEIWQFAVTSIALLALSASSWCLIRATHNFRICLRMDQSYDMIHWEKRIWVFPPLWFYLQLRRGYHFNHLIAMAFVLGFKRLDDEVLIHPLTRYMRH